MLNLVVALAAESRPLIEHFRLVQDRSAVGFRVYRGDAMRLVVTGAGRVASAAGVAALGERLEGSAAPAWLNIGVAGAAGLAAGKGVHALSITEAATGRCWYPPQVAKLPGQGVALRTVDAPHGTHDESQVYDTEAAAFYATALRYSTGELVQAYKIIVDDRTRDGDSVPRHGVRDAVIQHLPVLDTVCLALAALAREINRTRPRVAEFDHIVDRWHFTAPQRRQLHELMRRWAARSGGEPVLNAELNRCPSARALLGELSSRLETVGCREA